MQSQNLPNNLSLRNLDLIAGLGNIGTKYQHNRHNAGFLFIDYLHSQLQYPSFTEDNKFQAHISQKKIQIENSGEIKDAGKLPILLKPTTMMNGSGIAISKYLNFHKFKAQTLAVVFDDLDIPFGKYKIQFNKGPKVHNGINNIYQKLGTKSFWHIRIGVENRERPGNSQISGIEYSLQDFNSYEKKELDRIFSELLISINRL